MKKRLLMLMITVAVTAFTLASCGVKSDFTFEEVEGGIAITGYKGSETAIKIPEKIGGKTVVAIGEGAFDARPVTEVELPKTVTVIEKYAFRRCGKLTSVKILGNVRDIPSGAFNYCKNLTEIDLPDTVETIGKNAFGITGLKEIVLPDSVKTIGDYAFYNCAQLKSVKGGKGLESIGNNTFANCPHLTVVKLQEGLKKVGEYAFATCASLTEIELPSTVEMLEMGVLSATGIGDYHVSSGIKTISGYAFAGCKNMSKIYIPENVEDISVEAFKDCKGLVICGVRDSEAEIFADENGYKFEEYKFD